MADTLGNALAEQRRNNIVCNNIIPEVKLKKNGEPKMTHSNRVVGESSEVYGFTSKDEIISIMSVLNNKIEMTYRNKTANMNQSLKYNNDYWIAMRNKMMFVLGMNLGLRASDISSLRFSFFFDVLPDGSYKFKEFYSIQPKKTAKTRKFVKLFFNEAVKTALIDYVSAFPIKNIEDNLFRTLKGSSMTTAQMWNIVKETAEEAGIRKNVGSHTFRKTWGYWCYHSAENKTQALVTLQQCFNHSTPMVTLRYIGIADSDKEQMYNSICLGI